MPTRIFSYGGGWQSTAALVLAAERKIDFSTMIFSNVGEDSENLETLFYMDNYAIPFSRKHGIELIEVKKNGLTLLQYSLADNSTIPLPVKMSNGAPGTRKCTSDWKIAPVLREVRNRHGMAWKEPAIVGIGISMDESHRIKDSRVRYVRHEFPLIDLRIWRRDIPELIRKAGLPMPPKSACWFCPYQKLASWREMKRKNPDQFQQALELEQKLRQKLQKKNSGAPEKNQLYFTSLLRPLGEAITDDHQLNVFEENECSGYCHT